MAGGGNVTFALLLHDDCGSALEIAGEAPDDAYEPALGNTAPHSALSSSKTHAASKRFTRSSSCSPSVSFTSSAGPSMRVI